MYPETVIRRIAADKNKDNWNTIGIYLSKYKDKLERSVKKCDDKTDPY
jgi:hypothetical protein